MARVLALHVSTLCTILSFVYVSHSLERHSLTERPRLSSLLVLFLSGCICYAVSLLARSALGADGRFAKIPSEDSDHGLDEDFPQGLRAHVPGRPRKWSLPILILMIVVRLEIFHRVNYQQQCSTPGIHSFLCLILIGHQIFVTRRKWVFPPSIDDDDPWRSIFDDIYDWFSGPRVVMVNSVLSALSFSLGTYWSLSQMTRSGFMCLSPIDSHAVTFGLQLIGLVLDAVILNFAWRMLAWTRSSQQRIRLLASVLLLAALLVSFLYLGSTAVNGLHRANISFGSRYAFDIAVDSFVFATLLISLSSWICETSVITPFGILTIFSGIWNSCDDILHVGDWLQLSRLDALGPLWMIIPGAIVFIYLYDIRSIVFVRRVIVAILLLALLFAATNLALLRQPETFARHPISDFVYSAQSEHDRWMALASTSQSLSTAVEVYRERHGERAPPPNFGQWYEYAEGSAVIDDFPQIDRDLAPFWKIAPSTLRQRADEMAAMSDVGMIAIKNGQVTSRDTGDEQNNRDVAELVEVIGKFSKHLPNMVLPINLTPSPRVLPAWDETSPKSRAAAISSIADLLSKRSAKEEGDAGEGGGGEGGGGEGNATEAILVEVRTATDSQTAAGEAFWASDFRQMQVEACSPLSRSRTRPRWNFMEFCSACVRAHSLGQLVTKWQASLDVCSQPDLRLLHGQSLTDARQAPLRTLSPLFSASKTDEFKDIIMPMPRSRLERADVTWQFWRRYDGLVWRGRVGERGLTSQGLRGGHKFRLLHLANSPYAQDEVTLMTPLAGDESRFGYEKVKASKANELASFRFGAVKSADCLGSKCLVVEQAFGKGEQEEEAEDAAEPLEYRYVLLVDEEGGAAGETLRTLRSHSVPFISTIFRTWYTDRLMPWLHFVPIDVRYHGLHTTLMYFAGTEGKPKVRAGGREMPVMAGHGQDAEWIAQEGRKWAERALGRRDMECYVFRLLLEWGRLIDDSREQIGFRRDDKGGFQNDGWTSRSERQRNVG